MSGKIKNFSIEFTNRQSVYYPGQTISGYVTIVLTESIRVKFIKIGVFGEAKTRITYRSGDDTKTALQQQKFLEHVVTAFSSERVDKTHDNQLLLAGQYRHSFVFRLPLLDSLPSTFECNQPGNSIRYLVESWLEIPLRASPMCKKPFTFLQVIDCNAPNYLEPPLPLENEKSICCWCCRSGPLILRAVIDRKAFVPGEKITLVTAEVENYTERNMSGMAISLLQVVTRRAKGHTRVEDKSYASFMQSEVIKQGHCFTWADKSITIPCIPPTNTLSEILKVEYFLKVEVIVPLGINLEIRFPVYIGTIPRIEILQNVDRSKLRLSQPKPQESHTSDRTENPVIDQSLPDAQKITVLPKLEEMTLEAPERRTTISFKRLPPIEASMSNPGSRKSSLDITQEQQLELTNMMTNSVLPSKDCIEGRIDLQIERFPDCELIGEPIYTPQYPYYQPM